MFRQPQIYATDGEKGEDDLPSGFRLVEIAICHRLHRINARRENAQHAERALFLLIRPAFVFQPAGRMHARGIAMRPMHEPALRVPNILSRKTDRVADIQAFDTRSEVRVVFNQNRLTRWKTNDESLVRAAGCVIRQNA